MAVVDEVMVVSFSLNINLLFIIINIRTGYIILLRFFDSILNACFFILIGADFSFAKRPPPENITVALAIAFTDSATWFAKLNIPASANPKFAAKKGVKKFPVKKVLLTFVE